MIIITDILYLTNTKKKSWIKSYNIGVFINYYCLKKENRKNYFIYKFLYIICIILDILIFCNNSIKHTFCGIFWLSFIIFFSWNWKFLRINIVNTIILIIWIPVLEVLSFELMN